MATIQVRVDESTKTAADSLFSSLGFDTSTAVRMFLMASLENEGLPFSVKHRTVNSDLLEAVEDTRLRRNLHGPFKTAEEAVASMLEE
jgi:DNA-damage-inducible protein J